MAMAMAMAMGKGIGRQAERRVLVGRQAPLTRTRRTTCSTSQSRWCVFVPEPSTLEYPMREYSGVPHGARRRAFKPLLATGDDAEDACQCPVSVWDTPPARVSTLEYRRESTLEYQCVSTLEYPCGAKVGFNAFLDDVALAAAVRAHHGAWGTAELAELGAKVLRALTCCMGYSGYSRTHGVLWVLTHGWGTPGPTGAVCLLLGSSGLSVPVCPGYLFVCLFVRSFVCFFLLCACEWVCVWFGPALVAPALARPSARAFVCLFACLLILFVCLFVLRPAPQRFRP
jgi:hypothetical protein